MTSTVLNKSPYMRTSRAFPEEIQSLAVEINRTYIEIASKMNDRTIGLFPIAKPAITGENWYITRDRRQQSLRQIYPFTTTTSIPHGLNFANISQFTKPSGEWTDGTNWYGIIHGSNVAIPGQISFFIDPVNIVILVGAGAPALTSGAIVLEWLSLN